MAALMQPLPAVAVQSATLGAYPTGTLSSPTPWFRYRLERGQATTGSVTIDNRASSSQHVSLYPVDAAPNGDGGFGMQPQTSRPVDAGAWVHLDITALELPAHTAQNVGFEFRVPPNASVGPHYAGIIVQPSLSLAASHSGLSLQIVPRLGVRVYATIPGAEHPGLAIAGFAPKTITGQILLTARLHNTGNTLLAPSGRLDMISLLGRRATLPFNAGAGLHPNSTTTVTLPAGLSAHGPPIPYRAVLTLHYGSSPPYHTVSREIIVWTGDVVGWLIGLGLVVLVVLAAVVFQSRRHQRAERDRQRHQP